MGIRISRSAGGSMIFCEIRPFQNSSDSTVHPVFRGRQHVHLMSDDERELRLYADSIGLRPSWLQRDAFGVPHYDVVGARMLRVLMDVMVVKLERREFQRNYRALRRPATAQPAIRAPERSGRNRRTAMSNTDEKMNADDRAVLDTGRTLNALVIDPLWVGHEQGGMAWSINNLTEEQVRLCAAALKPQPELPKIPQLTDRKS